MTNLTRVTGKIFGETATATGDDPQIGQFGSALAGTYTGTTDVATIQNLTAWSNGFIDSVTPSTQFPPLPEMTGFGKVLSYQQNYLLQKGVAEWDAGTTYYTGDICKGVGTGILYVSKVNGNLNHAVTNTAYWGLYDSNAANQDLSNLTIDGNNRLHALKSYLDDGTALTDSEGLEDVKEYAHSTFDLSKFSVVGSPTITDDGIVSGLDKDNYLGKVINWDTTKSWEVRGKFVTPTSGSAEAMLVSTNAGTGMLLQLNTRVFNVPILRLLLGSVSNSWNITGGSAGAALNWNTTYYYIFKYTGTNYIIQISTDGENYTDYITVNNSTAIYSSFGSIRIGSWSAYGDLSDMKVDLKQFSITVDGVEVFNGNKTGVDTYTIGGLTVTIPYTLSKTGSKIVDSAYRTQVASVYNYQGYAPYYTLSDTDFTLPQGELYGMMLNQSTPHIVETYVSGTSGYNVYSNGYCEQWGYAKENVSISLLKEYKTTDYVIFLTRTDTEAYAFTPSVQEQYTSSFKYQVADDTIGGSYSYWMTKGYIN